MTAPTPATVELVAGTRFAECRLAAALAAKLVERCGSPSDVAFATRDIDRYEEPLVRAASRHGLTVSAWTQLRLKRTRPFRLVVAVCEALGGEPVDDDTLLDPLVLGWVPPTAADDSVDDERAAGDSGLLDAEALATARAELGADPDATRDLDGWADRASAAGLDAVAAFCDWAADQPAAPTPAAARRVLAGVVDRFRDRVLPAVMAADDRTLARTEETARAVARIGGDPDPEAGLLAELAATYGEWLARDAVTPSWDGVATVCEELATQAPGRREHSNARVVDLLEANDVWHRSFRYVVALGLVDGEWPQRPDGALPVPVRARIQRGDGPAGTLAVRAAWTEDLDHDHFADVVDAATTGLCCLRFERDAEGVAQERSPLLDGLEPTTLSAADRQTVLDPDAGLPAALAEKLLDTNGGAP